VSKLGEWGRWAWLEAQLAAPTVMRRTVIPCVREVKEIGRALLRPNLTIYQWQGQGKGGPLTVNYAGTGDAIQFLKGLLFVDRPVESNLGQVPFWHMRELADLPNGDITIVEAHKRLVRQLPEQDGLVLPVMMEMVLDVEGEWQDIERGFHSSAQRELRNTHKSGYDYEVSRSGSDFEMFYHDMYVPSTETRHRDQAVIMPIQEAYQYFRHGALFLVTRDGKRVSGSVFHMGRDMVRFIIVGVMHGDQQLMKEGAVGALNCLRIQWANKEGYKAVDFGYCRPFVGGLFRYKRKWGTAARAPSDLNQRIWIKLNHNTSAVYQFMKDNPCIFIGEEGQPHVLIVSDTTEVAEEENQAKLRKKFETPGLRGLLVRSMAELSGKPATRTTRIDPATCILF
jgi:hypothetical protein